MVHRKVAPLFLLADLRASVAATWWLIKPPCPTKPTKTSKVLICPFTRSYERKLGIVLHLPINYHLKASSQTLDLL